ncbi:2-aminobenzoate-CoA ligase [Sinosporangium album]|uniref:2-aminobenzoate-CoA ligase n=1 Tax=Sinosporangium album TaxID=504805 RepID=A0A1G7ZU44_9ACTN|nr:acyl-CoA synthetase [Sinosporangium album]SDH12174.1 2-aminobenzoate-CoA ligase [Sinosporangium album]
MRDPIPTCPAIPAGAMVPPELQPDYFDLPGHPVESGPELGAALTDLHVAAGQGGDVAIIHHETGRSLTYAELANLTNRVANAMIALGVVPGDRVAVRSPNRPEGVIAAIGAWKAGAAVVPIPMQARRAELEFLFSDTTPKLVASWTDAEYADDVQAAIAATGVRSTLALGGVVPPKAVVLGDVLASGSALPPSRPSSRELPGLVWHTGGTTGTPKACYHTQRRFLLGGHSIGAATGVRRGQRWAAAAPIGHALGFIYHTIFTLLHGATVVMVENFTKPDRLVHALAEHRVDVFTAIAATWSSLNDVLNSDPRLTLPHLRAGYSMWQSASSSATPDAWLERGVRLRNNFGSTAFATWVLVPKPGAEVSPASLGAPAPGYEVRALDPAASGLSWLGAGEIGRMAVRGPTGLTYWNRPDYQERDVRDGWNLVDDLICFDADGNADYLGRTDFLISTAGYKVAPGEVETVLSAHPDVREVAVVGLPDPVRQQVIGAFVALRENVPAAQETRVELQRFVRERLSPYKYPRVVHFIEALPRDHVGKVQSRRLLDMAETIGRAQDQAQDQARDQVRDRAGKGDS